MCTELSRSFRFDGWANREVALALAGLVKPPARAIQLLAHIGGAQVIWWNRLRGDSLPAPVWPDWDIVQCQTAVEEMSARWRDYVNGIEPTELARVVSYTNTAGESFRNTVADILRHVLLHGSYHRGQIATHVRLGGDTILATDYIFPARQGLLD